jgi:FdhD protein
MQEVEILRLKVGEKKADRVKDFVAQESALRIFLNRTFYAIILCSPSNQKELAIGHLLTEGIVRFVEEIEEVNVKAQTCKVKIKLDVNFKKRIRISRHSLRIILSECGGEQAHKLLGRLPKIKSDLSVNAETVVNCTSRLNSLAQTYMKTGGVHAAAIWTRDGVLVAIAEDVGRHNAVDKTIGMAMILKTDLQHCFLTLTGRLTEDIVLKSAMANLQIVASLAAATDSGIALARKINLSLIGFVRGRRMNIYSAPERIRI